MENERPENACLTKVQTRCGGVWGYAPPATWHAKVNSGVSDPTIRRAVSLSRIKPLGFLLEYV